MSIKNSVDFEVLLSFSLITSFRGTCSPFEILKGVLAQRSDANPCVKHIQTMAKYGTLQPIINLK